MPIRKVEVKWLTFLILFIFIILGGLKITQYKTKIKRLFFIFGFLEKNEKLKIKMIVSSKGLTFKSNLLI